MPKDALQNRRRADCVELLNCTDWAADVYLCALFFFALAHSVSLLTSWTSFYNLRLLIESIICKKHISSSGQPLIGMGLRIICIGLITIRILSRHTPILGLFPPASHTLNFPRSRPLHQLILPHLLQVYWLPWQLLAVSVVLKNIWSSQLVGWSKLIWGWNLKIIRNVYSVIRGYGIPLPEVWRLDHVLRLRLGEHTYLLAGDLISLLSSHHGHWTNHPLGAYFLPLSEHRVIPFRPQAASRISASTKALLLWLHQFIQARDVLWHFIHNVEVVLLEDVHKYVNKQGFSVILLVISFYNPIRLFNYNRFLTERVFIIDRK